MRELMPSQVIPGSVTPSRFPESLHDVYGLPIDGFSWAGTVQQVLAASFTDAFVVLRDGRLIAESYVGDMTRGAGTW